MKLTSNGFTLVELLVSLVIGAIIVLAIGVISGITHSSYKKATSEVSIYADITYGFKLFQNKVRGSQAITTTAPTGLVNPQIYSVGSAGTPTCTWVNTSGTFDRLFIFYNSNGTNKKAAVGLCDVGSQRHLVYMPNISSTSEKAAVMFYGTTTEFEKFTVAIVSNQATLTIKGTQNKVPFSLSTIVWRRTP